MQMDKPSKNLQDALVKSKLRCQLKVRMSLLKELQKVPTRTSTMLAMLKVSDGDAHRQQVMRTQQEIKARVARQHLEKSKQQLASLLGKSKNGK